MYQGSGGSTYARSGSQVEIDRIGDEVLLTIPLADESELTISLPIPAGVQELVAALREVMSEDEWTTVTAS